MNNLVRIAMLATSALAASAQTDRVDAAIRRAIHPLSGASAELAELGIFSCGQAVTAGDAIEDLVALGPEAVPALRTRVQSMIKSRALPAGAHAVLEAYVRIVKGQALRELRRLEALSKVVGLESEMAIALDQTAYASERGGYAFPQILCERPGEPQVALTRLMRGLVARNITLASPARTARAQASLASFLGSRGLSAAMPVREEQRRAGRAIGYKFLVDGGWARPSVIRIGALTGESARLSEADAIAIPTAFFSRSGRACGEQKIQFARVRSAYLVDEEAMGDLIAITAKCLLAE